MKAIVIKLAALTLLSVAVLGAACSTTSARNTASQLADGGQWGQKGGKGLC